MTIQLKQAYPLEKLAREGIVPAQPVQLTFNGMVRFEDSTIIGVEYLCRKVGKKYRIEAMSTRPIGAYRGLV